MYCIGVSGQKAEGILPDKPAGRRSLLEDDWYRERLIELYPDNTIGYVARELRVSERTVRRHAAILKAQQGAAA